MKRTLGDLVIITWVVFACSISAAQQLAPYRLTLRDALEKGLQANLSVLVADTRRTGNRRHSHTHPPRFFPVYAPRAHFINPVLYISLGRSREFAGFLEA